MNDPIKNNEPLLIRVDADAKIGTGHLMRCLALAQAWLDKGGKVLLISRCESEALRQRIIAEGIDLIPLDKFHADPFDRDFTASILEQLQGRDPKANPWLVVDGYHFDGAYQKRIKSAGYKLLWIDDYGHADHYYADLVLNQNISADPLFYLNREPHTQLLLGTRYALLRREFNRWQGWQRAIPPIGKKILVTLGGGDPDKVTLKVVQALKQVDVPGMEARIVIGPANPYGELLEKEIRDKSRLYLLANVADMPELMAWADVAITAGGSTCWELAFMGLPAIALILADNQRPVAEKLGAQGAVVNLGWHADVTADSLSQTIGELVAAKQLRMRQSGQGRKIVDGKGAIRVISKMVSVAHEPLAHP